MDDNEEPVTMEWVVNGVAHRWPVPKNLLQSMKEQFGIFPEGALFKDINLPVEDVFMVPQTWGIQIIYEGTIVREWFIGETKLRCYFEDTPEIEITKEQQVMLHEFCLKLLKKDYPGEYGDNGKR